jgi:hypothetical protein
MRGSSPRMTLSVWRTPSSNRMKRVAQYQLFFSTLPLTEKLRAKSQRAHNHHSIG